VANPDIGDGYTARGAYQILTTQDPPFVDVTRDLIWHNQVPLKVSILAWRLLRDRLPTKNNLFRRGIIQANNVQCVAGCETKESISHLFLHCELFGSLWQHVRLWIGTPDADPQNIHDHFIQFIHSIGHSRTCISFLQLVWLVCIWLVWTERNNRIFNNIQTPMDQIMEKVKHHSFWWLKANNATFVFGSHRWWSDPLTCLGIG
jgi:hypothetical protein